MLTWRPLYGAALALAARRERTLELRPGATQGVHVLGAQEVEVDVHGQSGHIQMEEVECGTTLQHPGTVSHRMSVETSPDAAQSQHLLHDFGAEAALDGHPRDLSGRDHRRTPVRAGCRS